MKCSNCLYENSCSLKEIANDITGCDGHSKERPPKEGEVRCLSCGNWVDISKVFTHNIYKNKYICFECF